MKKFAVAMLSMGTVLIAGQSFADGFLNGLTCNDRRGCKVCSGGIPANYRDTITVPQTWTPETCRQFAQFVVSEFWQLGCLNKDSFVFGDSQDINVSTPNLPLNNTCNW